ncbi:MAG: hypothetical protein NTW87_16795 [Planctomycetota bacterium]|nr:hypothetical protein [Planctomycetota bacterium]
MTSTTAAKNADVTAGVPYAAGSLPVGIGTARTATGQDLMPRDTETSYVVAYASGTGARREKPEGGGRVPPADMVEVSRYLRRIAEQLVVALEEDAEDVLARDAAIRETLPLWGLAFKHRHCLQEPLRELLSHLLTCLSSPLAVQNDVALRQLHAVVLSLSQHVRGTTEKDVENWIVRLEEAGFDLTAPLTAEAPPEGSAEHISE